MASRERTTVSAHTWPPLSRRVKIALVVGNVLALVSYIYVAATFSGVDCSGGGCSDYGFVLLIRPDLLAAYLVASIIPILDAGVAYYLVGSRIGLGMGVARRVTLLLFVGMVMVWATFKLMHIG